MDIRSCRPADLEQLIPLLDEEFVVGKGRAISLRQRFPTVFCRDNLHNIILYADGEAIASALSMRQFDWRKDGEIFRGAMIGAVYTHPERRGKGLASRLLETAATQLREQKIDFGVLWAGRQTLYSRLGWVAADCGVFGDVELNGLTHEPLGDVTLMPLEAGAPRLESVRRHWLSSMILRRPEDYRQLPLPAERVNLLWRDDQGNAAYALLGSSAGSGFLYELTGDTDNFPALWREARRGHRRIFVNDHADSPSCRWLTNHTEITWQSKRLAMWLPLSKRVAMSRLGQLYIPYFDRI